jgi:precorrin-6B C5,15-methyltransferase / cobalt-precorrin-6B C5,C15-methyltransferase
MSAAAPPATRIVVLGMDGDRPPAGSEGVLARATLIAGGRRQLAALSAPTAQTLPLAGPLEPVLDRVAAHAGTAVVLASGDPGFFGIVRALGARVGAQGLDVRPAASSVAVAFARLGLAWDDAIVVSAHGRDPHAALAVALRHPKVAILTAPDAPPSWFAQRLPGRRIVVAERLGTPQERLREGDVADGAEPNVVLVLDPQAEGERARVWPPRVGAPGWALPDAAFEHRAGMVTKAEVRAVALARLGPGLGDLVWDVGCGCGSVAVECARLGAAAIAVDADPAAVALTARNAAAHGVPVQTVAGTAPGALDALPDPDAAFVGGGGDDLEAIVDVCAARARRVVVVTLALVERAGPTLERLAAAGLQAEATLVQASRLRPLAGGHRLAAENPVVVAWGLRP